MTLAENFQALGPWVTKFNIDGNDYGGDFDAVNDVRIAQFFEVFPNVRTVLELGSLEGGHSFALARRPSIERVLAIEARDANIGRSRFIQKLLNDQKVEFLNANVESLDLADLGAFDAVFCSGILYHLPEPWRLIEKCRRVSPRLFIWTQYACEKEAKKFANGYRGKWWKEGGWSDPLSGVSKWSFWLSLGSLIEVLTRHGFDRIQIIENNLRHPHGCAVTLCGWSSETDGDDPTNTGHSSVR